MPLVVQCSYYTRTFTKLSLDTGFCSPLRLSPSRLSHCGGLRNSAASCAFGAGRPDRGDGEQRKVGVQREVAPWMRKRMIWQTCERVGICKVKLDSEEERSAEAEVVSGMGPEREDPVRKVKQVALWVMAAVYTSWLFFLPYAPGDPIWAISSATITGILGLSLNFFYVLPLANMVGFHLLEAAVAHPADESLFNFVLGWALLFAPLIFTDRKRNRFPGSLDVFWLLSMFLTNTLLIPYMAIRLNGSVTEEPGSQAVSQITAVKKQYATSGLQRAMTSGARIVAITGSVVGFLSVIWFTIGRPSGGYGNLVDRWNYFLHIIGSDRPTYAFIWDLCCYTIFQPWLIGDNLQNVRIDRVEYVRTLRFVPYIGLVAYCWGLEKGKENED